MSALAPPASPTIKRCTPALGAEIAGVDLARDIDDATFARIRQALDECLDHERLESTPVHEFVDSFAVP